MALALILVFLYAVGTSVVLPTPLEAVLSAVKLAPGWAVIAVAVLGKLVGAYLVFWLAVRVKGLPRVQAWQGRNRYARWLMEFGRKWVDRYGAPALFLLLLIPGFPDTGAVYLLAVAGGRPVAFSLATAGAGAVRLSLAYLGIMGLSRTIS